jgi:hypothetical protein
MLVPLARGCVRGLLALLLLPASLAAQATGVVTGRVTTGGAGADSVVRPVRGATVSIAGTALVATAGADGRWTIGRVPAGQRTVRVRLLGYRTAERTVTVVGGDTVRVAVALDRQAQVLAPVRTEGRPTDAEAFGALPNVGTVTLEAAQIAGVPSVGEPDVARVVRLLPGVAARNDFNTGFNVRGGEADQNLILLDGHPIYNPFHLGGLFSTFMDATVGGIELMTGAFPARYGGRLSSVLDVRSADVARAGVHGSADLSVLAATGRLAGATRDGRATWSLAGRRTYADAVVGAFTEEVLPYHFHDVQARATYAFPGDWRLAVTGYLGDDVLDVDIARLENDSVPTAAGNGTYAFDWGNRVVGVTLAKDFGALPLGLGEGGTFEQRVSWSSFAMALDLGEGAYSQRSSTRDLRASGSFTARGARHDKTVGWEAATHRLRFASGSAETATSDFDLVQRPTTGAAWIGDLWRVSDRWIVEGGLRGEAMSSRNWVALSPRLSVKLLARPDLAFTAAAGRFTQQFHSISGDGPLRYFDVWLASDPYIPVATAWHFVTGAERRLGDEGTVRVEGWIKRYDRVLEPNASEDPGRRGDEFFAAKGDAYGADLIARWQPTTGLGGWISYTYGVASRSRGAVRWAPSFDRRHDLNAVAMWRVSRYRLGARFGFASGTPYTPIVGEIARRVWDPSRDSWGTGDPRVFVEPLGGARNGARFPATHRLDLDASREFTVRGTTLAPYVSVVNAYNAPNVFVYLYDYSTDAPTRQALSQFPVVPSVGVRVAF